jgi:hypothetical protein
MSRRKCLCVLVCLLLVFVSFKGAVAQSVIDEDEPNNDVTTATRLQPGQTVRGTVASTGLLDPDVFAFDARSGEPVTIKIARIGGASVVQAYVTGPDSTIFSGPLAVEYIFRGETREITFLPEQSGMHFITLLASDAASYEVTLTSGAVGDGTGVDSDPNEPNDDRLTATQTRSGDTRLGAISDETDIDVFAIDARAGESVTFNLTNVGDGGGSLNVTIVSPNGQAVTFDGSQTVSIPDNTYQELTVSDVQPSGVLYYSVSAGSGTGLYELTATVVPTRQASSRGRT